MAYDPDDPNQGSQYDVQQSAANQQQAYYSLLQQIQKDPDITAALQSGGPQAATTLMQQRYHANGMYGDETIDSAGQIHVPDQSNRLKAFLTLAAVAALPFAVYGATAGIGALGGGGAASSGAAAGTGTTAASGAAATTAGTAAAPVVAGGASTAPGFVAGGAGAFDAAGNWVAGSTAANPATFAAAGASPSLWSKIAAPLATTAVSGAFQYAGTKAQIDAQQHASDVQAKYLQDALDWQKAQYAQRRTDLSPAINTGNAATYKLGDLMGLPATSGPYAPPTPAHQDLGLPTTSTGPANNWSPSTPPAPVQPGTAATGNQGPTVNGQPQMVALRSPNGTVGYVPIGRVNDALAAGAQRV